jgi:Ca2+-binding RTX toxin-like protein
MQEDFPANRLLIRGTSGPDSVALNAHSTGWRINTVWNGQTSERRSFASGQIADVQLFTLGGNDFVTILGSTSLPVNLRTGRGDDWISVQNASATITDLHGNNFISTGSGDDTIHTGTGDDEIDAGGGQNKITDEGGLNSISTGAQNDRIYHTNADDAILAGSGINDIWLNGVLKGWSNPKLPLDVDRDGRISPIDALLLIEEINKVGTRRLLGSPDSVSFYLDPDNDGFLTPLDVLALVTWLNRSSGAGSGESNSDGPTESFLDSLATERQHNADVYFSSYEEDLLPESLKRRRRGI